MVLGVPILKHFRVCVHRIAKLNFVSVNAVSSVMKMNGFWIQLLD